MKFEKTEVFNFQGALRGMRNPMNSWDKSDSGNGCCKETNNKEFRLCRNCGNPYCDGGYFQIGENDLKLAQTLIKAGGEHRKFMRQIFVSVDITAPLYWWKEFDTYKVGTVANSTSTMHKLASTQITKDCFEHGDMIYQGTIAELEMNRLKYLESKDMNEWKRLIVNLPESWLQTRTITMNYENLRNMTKHRKNHKLTEWSKSFIDWAKSLPYADELIFINEKL